MVPMRFLKKVQPINGPAVWPAIAYVIYINEQKLYYIEEDILVPYRYFCPFSNQGIFRNLIIM